MKTPANKGTQLVRATAPPEWGELPAGRRGANMPGRSYSSDKYRFGFNGKENDNEIKGVGNSLDFGARIYDPRTLRWSGCDKKQIKYAGWSPYHFGYCNPIIVIDPNGEENIVVVGNQGYSPNMNENRDNNQRHFLEAGLNEALRLQATKTTNDEGTTMLVYKGNYSDKELQTYKARAEKLGITFIEVSKAKEITNYINTKNVQGHITKNWFLQTPRTEDKITDFSYVGHGWSKALYTGYNAVEKNKDKDALYTKRFKAEAFDVNCDVNLNSCGSGFDVMDDFVNRLVGGTVTGYRVTVIWGEKGVGTSRAFEKWYYPPGDERRNSKDRPTVPAEDRVRTEQGKRSQ